MKVVSSEALTKLIQLSKDEFLSKNNTTTVITSGLKTINGESILGTGNIDTTELPSQSGQSGKFLTTNGSTTSWATVDALPDQTGNNGKVLLTDGVNAYWANVSVFDLFDHKWSDHILNDISWLRADTFSWQSGTVYTDAYNHLKDELDACVADPDYATKYERTETISGYTITYCLCPDGHKIVTDYWETTVANIYAATGIAWYYIIDTTNQRFKLPRTKYGFTGLRDEVGKYVPQSLPNISSGNASVIAWYKDTPTWTQGSLKKVSTNAGALASSGAWTYSGATKFDASLQSSTYQDNAPVQQRATQMYLYFYVGQFSQSAIEQTTGITTEALNNKIDIDLGNATTKTKKTVVGWSMPSNIYIEVSHSNGTYTAPANGYFQMSVNINDRQRYAYCGIDASGIYSKEWGNEYTTDDFRFFIPVKKGDVINYGLSGGSWNYARFIYAQGEI